MKQNITALIIFALIISGAVFSLNYTNQVSREITDTLKLCEDYVMQNNWSSATMHISNTKNLWDKYHPRLAVLLSHRELNEISDLIVTVTSLVFLNDKNTFITENKRLTALVENLNKGDSLTFENLF
ncbi:MAG: DUF4363 family protein [Clostridia bacterium]|nr:DUF4363 family protein [Clostridia bacterium]